MNEHRLDFKLTRAARKSGGDRYECNLANEPKPMVIYIPQVICRENGKPKERLTLTISD